jgi:hypothetical protein
MKSRAIMLGVILVTAIAQSTAAALAGNDDAQLAFERTWRRTDLPVSSGLVQRSWIWGPAPVTTVMFEQYEDAAIRSRPVQYYDKERMEVSDSDADQNSI